MRSILNSSCFGILHSAVHCSVTANLRTCAANCLPWSYVPHVLLLMGVTTVTGAKASVTSALQRMLLDFHSYQGVFDPAPGQPASPQEKGWGGVEDYQNSPHITAAENSSNRRSRQPALKHTPTDKHTLMNRNTDMSTRKRPQGLRKNGASATETRSIAGK